MRWNNDSRKKCILVQTTVICNLELKFSSYFLRCFVFCTMNSCATSLFLSFFIFATFFGYSHLFQNIWFVPNLWFSSVLKNRGGTYLHPTFLASVETKSLAQQWIEIECTYNSKHRGTLLQLLQYKILYPALPNPLPGSPLSRCTFHSVLLRGKCM